MIEDVSVADATLPVALGAIGASSLVGIGGSLVSSAFALSSADSRLFLRLTIGLSVTWRSSKSPTPSPCCCFFLLFLLFRLFSGRGSSNCSAEAAPADSSAPQQLPISDTPPLLRWRVTT